MSPSEWALLAERTGLREMLRRFPQVLQEAAAKVSENRLAMPAQYRGTCEPAHRFVVPEAPVD